MNYPIQHMSQADAMDLVLGTMTDEVDEVNRANGWYDSDRRPAEGLALIHSEVSEWLEALRADGIGDTTVYCGQHLPDYLPDDVRATYSAESCTCAGKAGRLPKPVLIRLLDECDRQGIDLGAEYRRKIAFNRTRGHRHGGKVL